jgi:hypothetical protein
MREDWTEGLREIRIKGIHYLCFSRNIIRRDKSRTKSVVFWVITRRRVVIIYRSFETTCRSHLHGSRFLTPCNYPKDHRLHQHRGGSLKSKSRTVFFRQIKASTRERTNAYVYLKIRKKSTRRTFCKIGLFFHGAAALSGPGPPHCLDFTLTLRQPHAVNSGRVISPMQRPLPDNTQHSR